jgi:hypothetical protein
MRRKVILCSLVLVGSAGCSPKAADSDQESVDALRTEARGKVKAFAGSLKGELMQAMKEGGPTKAIEVCNTRAPAISEAASTDGWTLARRSARLRNPRNQADAWEKVQLESFASRMAEGEAVQELEHAEIVEVDGARLFRYAKAIPLGGECLGCHGKELAPEVAAALDARYPEDEARGYAAGELRGIFSLSKTLSP